MQQQKINIRHRLLTKLQLSHLIVVVLPIALAALFLVNTAQNSIEKTIQNRNLEFAQRVVQLIITTLDYAQAIVKITAQNPLIYESNRISQELTINNLVKCFQIFKEVCLLDSSGAVSISTSYRQETYEYKNSTLLNQLDAGESYYSEIYLARDKHLVMDIAEPIRYRNEVIGALFVSVDLRVIWELIENSRIGERGQAFIIDRNGFFLAHSERKKVYLKETFEQEDILRDINSGMTGQAIYRNSDGVALLTSYAPLTIQQDLPTDSAETANTDILSSPYPLNSFNQKAALSSFSQIALENLGLGVVIQQPLLEAFASAKKMRYQMILFAVLSILTALILASINTQRILSPISKLISGIERFASGNLDYKIEPLGKDEIGTLSRRFNAMAVRLIEYQDKLKRAERLELMNKMSSVLSHEIRNPLNSMVINMQIMRREFLKQQVNREKLEKYHQIVTSEVQRVDQLVNKFLLIARPHKLKKEKIAIDILLNEIIVQQQSTALHRGIRVERKFDVHDFFMRVDPARLRQAFLNIYLNGIQAMQGGGKFTIKLSLPDENLTGLPDKTGKTVLVQFIDTGKGIPPDVLKHIFDLYFTTKESGTGLGLSIASQIIEEHAGNLTAESSQNKGSAFSVYLPVYS